MPSSTVVVSKPSLFAPSKATKSVDPELASLFASSVRAWCSWESFPG